VIARTIGVLVFAAGAVVLVGGLAMLGRAPGLAAETRHLREMKDRGEAPATLRDMTMDDFAALPHQPPMVERVRWESQGVRMVGWVQRILLSGDGDVHVELAEHRRTRLDRDTVYVVCEISIPWRHLRKSWAYDSLLVAFRPNSGGATEWEAGPRRVRISGWLLYDHPYDKLPSNWVLTREMTRRTGWEIHPVTGIELWEDATQSWTELSR
jgi:hypothetical protein